MVSMVLGRYLIVGYLDPQCLAFKSVLHHAWYVVIGCPGIETRVVGVSGANNTKQATASYCFGYIPKASSI